MEVDPKDPRQGEVMLREPAILARVSAAAAVALPLGEAVKVRLVEADMAMRRIRFEWLD